MAGLSPTKLESQLAVTSKPPDEGKDVPSSAASSSARSEEDGPALPPKWYRRLNPLRWQKRPPIPTEQRVSREYGAGFLSIVTFQWMSPLLNVGYLRPLELQDIWKVNPDRAVEVLTVKLEAALKRRLDRGDSHPLLFALYDTFKLEFLLGGVCQFFSALFQVFSPYTTRYLIQFATDAYIAQVTGQPGPPVSHGIGIAIGIACMQFLQSMGTNQFTYRGMTVGGQSRAVLINILFDKAMKLSNRAKAGGKADANDRTVELESAKNELLKGGKVQGDRHKVTADAAKEASGNNGSSWSNGRIITLMSVDAERINLASGMFHILWTAPISLIVTLILLIINLGPSALSGYALLVLGMPLLTYTIRSLVKRRKKINEITDQRVSLTQEILQSVRFVKFFGWEGSFLGRLESVRKREIHGIQTVLALRNAVQCALMALPIFASMLAFVTYSLSDHNLTPAPIFSSLGLFNSLRMPLNLFPLVMGQVVDAWTALNRIEEFLLAEEQTEYIQWDESMDNAIETEHASFTWEQSLALEGEQKKSSSPKEPPSPSVEKIHPQQVSPVKGENDSIGVDTSLKPFKLMDVSFSVKRNELLAVIGTVGSGKTSLLAALAGDMRLTGGEMKMAGTRAFCPQSAWIQNTSAKSNIIFGQEFDEKWYNEVVEACALRPDFNMFPAGDSTEIGERGITISGGQKQRLNIARAIYFNADIVLMDDPLSAVDAHVGRHIMDHAICGLLKDKCRVLATHQLHVLGRCDRIIVMEDGRIGAIDTFDNLMRDNKLFQRLLSSTSQEGSRNDNAKGDHNGSGQGPTEDGTVEPKAKQATLMQQEERAVDSVSWGVWKAYILASGSFLNAFIILLALVLTNGVNIMSGLWLAYWTSNKYPLSLGQYIGIYAGIAALVVVLMFTFSTVLAVAGTNASKVMMQRAMARVLRAPMSFFDTTPLGRIMNRFSKDISVMDNELTEAMRIYSLTTTMIVSVMVLIIVFYNYFGIALAPLLVLFLLAANYYRASARDIKRHEAVLRSHVFARFGEAITGTASIRAYGLQALFRRRLCEAIDDMDGAYFLTFSNQRWLSVRLDAVGNLLVLITGILVVTSRFNVPPSISGLVLSYILAIVQMLQFTIRQLAEVENNMNSTERIHYYGTQLEEEAPLHLARVEPEWPHKGRITFTDVEMRYRPGLPLVLRNFSMDIQGGERIGIVGRTGAGKSSIMTALFRITELSGGSIEIDGVDIATVGLYDLRSRLAIIPQDPTLFHGTVRSNLDPFNEHTDLELWSALRKADLVGAEPEAWKSLEKGALEASPEEKLTQNASRIQLDTVVDEAGSNFSLGQRQLMALARALVRDSRIIICDEATSSVDFETDRKIQQTMATGFKGKTLLCIAHRLHTIISYDRICVMDQGKIAEMDTPLKLWEQEDSIFRGMCDRSGITGKDILGEDKI